MSNFCRTLTSSRADAMRMMQILVHTPGVKLIALGPSLLPLLPTSISLPHCLPCADMVFLQVLCSCGSQEIFQISKRFSKSLISKDTSSSNIQDVNIHGFLWEFNLWNNKGIELGTKALSWRSGFLQLCLSIAMGTWSAFLSGLHLPQHVHMQKLELLLSAVRYSSSVSGRTLESQVLQPWMGQGYFFDICGGVIFLWYLISDIKFLDVWYFLHICGFSIFTWVQPVSQWVLQSSTLKTLCLFWKNTSLLSPTYSGKVEML